MDVGTSRASFTLTTRRFFWISFALLFTMRSNLYGRPRLLGTSRLGRHMTFLEHLCLRCRGPHRYWPHSYHKSGALQFGELFGRNSLHPILFTSFALKAPRFAYYTPLPKNLKITFSRNTGLLIHYTTLSLISLM